jgi:hypothetical protein
VAEAASEFGGETCIECMSGRMDRRIGVAHRQPLRRSASGNVAYAKQRERPLVALAHPKAAVPDSAICGHKRCRTKRLRRVAAVSLSLGDPQISPGQAQLASIADERSARLPQ